MLTVGTTACQKFKAGLRSGMPSPTVSADTAWVVDSLCPSQVILTPPEEPADLNCWAVALGEAKGTAFGESAQILLPALQRPQC